MIYTDKWAFIHIPKTSGINLKLNAMKYLDNVKMPYDYKDPRRVKAEVVEHNPYWYWQEHILTDQQAFTIVRNPYYRAASLWHYTTQKYKMFLKKYQDPNKFIDFLNRPPDFKDSCWNYKTNQVDFIKSNNHQVCKVYKYETDLKNLQSYLKFPFLDTNLNSAEEVTPNKLDYDSFYQEDKTRIEFVNETYKKDFETFGYKMMDI